MIQEYLYESIDSLLVKVSEDLDVLLGIIIAYQNAVRDAKLSTSDIDEVILVGGSSRIPAVQTLV